MPSPFLALLEPVADAAGTRPPPSNLTLPVHTSRSSLGAPAPLCLRALAGCWHVTVGKDALSLVINRSLCFDGPSICSWRIIPRPVEVSFSHLQLSMTQLFIDSLPLLISLLHSLPIFFGIASQVNHLHSNPSILEDSGQ